MAESNEVKSAEADKRPAPPPPSASMPPDGAARTLGESCALGLAASLVASLPVALRASGEGGSALGGLVASTAVLVIPLVALVRASQAAGRALRLVTGRGAQRSTAVGLALWAGLSAPIFLVLASALKAATNHRGLGGATFGALALLVAIGTALAAHRIVAIGRRYVERGVAPSLVDRVCLAIAFVPVLLAAVVGLRASDGTEASSRLIAALVDGALASVATILAASFDLPRGVRRGARLGGVFAAALVLVVGLAWVERSPTLSRAVQARGGLGPAILSGLEGWTDRDGDGAGAHFGGLDCDDGDPRSHLGALDVTGDGLDTDCDGADGARVLAVVQPVQPDATPRAPAGPNAAAVHRTGGAAARSADKPSIVLVTMDSVRADRTSTFGYDKKTTPALDALAARGVAFDHAYAVASDTQRAIAPLVSGRRLSRTARDTREWPTIHGSVDTLAERMRAAGYATAAVTSFTWLSKDRGFDQGFDDFEPAYEKDHPERGVTGPHAVAAARAIVAKRDSDPRPLFLWVHLFDAHERWVAHPGGDFGKTASGLYDGEVAFVDKQVAALVEALGASSRADTAAFIVHGTHGEGFGEHDVEGHGRDLWEQQIHVPLVIALPAGSSGGERRVGRYARGAVSMADLPATILELGGGAAEGVEGRSLAAIARGALETPGVAVDARSSRRAAWIDWPLKLLVTKRKGKNKDRYVLFDLAADPNEEKDLAGSRNEDLVRMIAMDQRLDEEGAAPSD